MDVIKAGFLAMKLVFRHSRPKTFRIKRFLSKTGQFGEFFRDKSSKVKKAENVRQAIFYFLFKHSVTHRPKEQRVDRPTC